MSSADYLRTTAADMRAKAEAATPGPWWDRSTEHGRTAPHYGEFGWYVPGCPAGETDDTPQGRADAALIAYTSPTFALAVAEWLEAAAVTYEEMRAYCSQGAAESQAMAAMAVARAWNGEA